MMQRKSRQGFTIIELLIVVIVIGILAAAGLAKYQNFAETSRRKACLGQLHALETGLGVWETTNTGFAENAKCAWGYTVRAGRLTDTSGTPVIYPATTAGTIPNIGDAGVNTVGAPSNFLNSGNIGPLNTVIRDDNIWDCPSAESRYYGGEIQNLSDDYMDTTGGGVSPAHGGTTIGLGGRYLMVVAGNITTLNGGFPGGWIHGSTLTPAQSAPSPCPQKPLKLAICGCYGTFGTGAGTSNVPGSSTTNAGGPVGPDGSTLNRHSSRW